MKKYFQKKHDNYEVLEKDTYFSFDKTIKLLVGAIGAAVIPSKANAEQMKRVLKCPSHKEVKKAVKEFEKAEREYK